MSFRKRNLYAATPNVTRGKPLHVGGDPKGENFLYACGNSIFIRNIKNPLLCDMYSEHSFPTTVARYAPSGFYIASADSAGTVRVWDTTQEEHPLKIELKVLAGPIYDLQWSPDSQRIVAVGEGKERFGAAFLWDSGASVGEITGHSKAIYSCDFKKTRPFRVITGGEDFQTNWFEGPPFKFKKAMKDHTRFVCCTRFSPDGNRVASVGLDKKIFVYGGKDGDKMGEVEGHAGGVYSCSWSADSAQLLTASGDKTAKLWDVSTMREVATFSFSDSPGVEHQQLGTLWQGDFLLSFALSGDINYLDPRAPNRPVKVVHGHNKFTTAVAHDPASSTLYTGSYDAVVTRWNVDSGETAVLEGKGHTNQINALQVQNGVLVSAAMDDSIRYTPLETREYSASSVGTDANPSDLRAATKDSGLVVSATREAILVLRSGAIASKTPADWSPTTLALSPDGRQLAVGGKDNKIHLFSLAGDSLTPGKVLEGQHRGPLTSVQFSPDGTRLASADANRDIFVWDTSSWEVTIRGWVFHTARVNTISWSPDSLHLASGSLDQNIIVWSVEDPNKRIIIKGAHQGGVNQVLWLDNNTVASVGQDSTLKTWSVSY